MNLFKKKSSEELIEETKKLKAQLDNVKVKNEIKKNHRNVKDQLRKEKREEFENSIAGKVLKGLKKELEKKQKKNKQLEKPTKKKEITHKEYKYELPLLRE